MKKISDTGFIRIAAATPKLSVANADFNAGEIRTCIMAAEKKKAGVILFPELCITGSTCADLFCQDYLYKRQLEALCDIAKSTEKLEICVIAGFYLRITNVCLSCAAVIHKGEIKGIVPKKYSSHEDSADSRWFAAGCSLAGKPDTVNLFGKDIPFGDLLFCDAKGAFSFGVVVGKDMEAPVSPLAGLVREGAAVVFNPAASAEAIGKADFAETLFKSETAKNLCAAARASAGVCESTTDYVFSGQDLIVENGNILEKNERFESEGTVIFSEIDFERISFERAKSGSFAAYANISQASDNYTRVLLEGLHMTGFDEKLTRHFEQNPFVPEDENERNAHCEEIFKIQTSALARRIRHSHSKTSVVGISGGLDSTLALLVTTCAHRMLGKPAGDVIAVTMPGFGTTGKTYNNALTIMKLLGADVREIPIRDAVTQHFADIGHDISVHDVTYENAQARERTQILMDVANGAGGLVVGTGDLSELALGWCTYNGDHMAMYGVNAGIPKTLVRVVVKWIIDNRLSGPSEDKEFSSDNALLAKTLQDILDTPISPELLPPDEDGKMTQKTEDSVGPYILHDFFIYHTLRNGTNPRKLLYLAENVFEGEFDKDCIVKWMSVFYRRFFNQQFKRSCSPDGPKVGSVVLSPRGGLVMPSDADSSMWLAAVEELKKL
ncbi:MAG: NAD(+) synthase [Clostridia bacterium]|nr:NAD(+) synthase [Clostridia bacterium]